MATKTVRMLQHMVGIDYEREIGKEYQVDEDEADRMVAAELAKPVAEAKTKKPKARETATRSRRRTAAHPAPETR